MSIAVGNMLFMSQRYKIQSHPISMIQPQFYLGLTKPIPSTFLALVSTEQRIYISMSVQVANRTFRKRPFMKRKFARLPPEKSN